MFKLSGESDCHFENKTLRLRRAKALLEHGECSTVAQVAALVGFDDPLYFSKLFRQTYGHPPSESR